MLIIAEVLFSSIDCLPQSSLANVNRVKHTNEEVSWVYDFPAFLDFSNSIFMVLIFFNTNVNYCWIICSENIKTGREPIVRFIRLAYLEGQMFKELWLTIIICVEYLPKKIETKEKEKDKERSMHD